MTQYRIYVVWKHHLFRESVQQILNHDDIEWVGSNSDYLAANDEIQHLQPETVIIEEIAGNLPLEMKNILEISTWNIQLIGINLNDNKLSIYHHEYREVRKEQDLLKVIIKESR